ncbi:hypothetical protein DU19_0141 [Chlamydia muridarum]|nr:hypothetical protein DU17_0141 [Chlamydia muridarum]KDU81120.1 hypothetical protein DU18_0142 [Chlamydia muridarum]KDU82795.1 hypothetical protein DU19_0141 [Chlamydia muridarum]KDU83072.1 hypothetical protein DU20_0141 [Chlamydia muridarum]KDU84271.1 hypothetical protein DU21_0141 [Chlamydia muridarum]
MDKSSCFRFSSRKSFFYCYELKMVSHAEQHSSIQLPKILY